MFFFLHENNPIKVINSEMLVFFLCRLQRHFGFWIPFVILFVIIKTWLCFFLLLIFLLNVDSIQTGYYMISLCFILIYNSTENNRVITCIRASVNPIFIANSSLWMKKKERTRQIWVMANSKWAKWERERNKIESNCEVVRVRKMGSEMRLDENHFKYVKITKSI